MSLPYDIIVSGAAALPLPLGEVPQRGGEGAAAALSSPR